VHSESYILSLSNISVSFWYKKQLDSAIYYNKLAIEATKDKKNRSGFNKLRHDRLRISEAFHNYDKGNYKIALDSITKYIDAVDGLSDSIRLANTYLYQGKSYVKLNDWEHALPIFKKVDTIIQQSKSYSTKIRDNYSMLHNYYRKQNDLKNQLLYLEKLLKFDSVLNTNKDIIKDSLLIKYETPKLLETRDQLISELKSEKNSRLNLVYTLLLSTLVFLILTTYYYRKKIIYKKRFEKIITEHKPIKKIVTTDNIKKVKTVPEATVVKVLTKMKAFEEDKKFLSKNVTLNSVAKTLGTNSNYLSKIINTHKQKNFSAYITDLRIDYVIEALKTQSKLREYTIKAIAFEVGFKNAESFTIAFHKQTKLYPSYFIKELQKKKAV